MFHKCQLYYFSPPVCIRKGLESLKPGDGVIIARSAVNTALSAAMAALAVLVFNRCHRYHLFNIL
jgi:hypothetical protein